MNVGKLSLYYVIFENVENDLLRLIDTKDFRKFPDNFNQILRYNGKTNEQFTRMMLNVTESVCKTNSKTMKLLDPMCGKATTLIEGLIQGLDVVGVEINEKVTKEVQAFVARYLKEGRYKHNTKTEKTLRNGGKKIAECCEVNTASDKE